MRGIGFSFFGKVLVISPRMRGNETNRILINKIVITIFQNNILRNNNPDIFWEYFVTFSNFKIEQHLIFITH